MICIDVGGSEHCVQIIGQHDVAESADITESDNDCETYDDCIGVQVQFRINLKGKSHSTHVCTLLQCSSGN